MNIQCPYIMSFELDSSLGGLPKPTVRWWWARSALILSLLLVAGCDSESLDSKVQDPAITAADISGPQVWGTADNVMQVKHLYFSAQPDDTGLVAAGAAGVGVVINLREPEEMTWDEASAVTQQSLAYYQVPLAGEGASFSRDAMQRVSELVKANHDKQIWLHCSSGNRAAAWLAVHLVQDHNMAVDQALARAREVGITKPEVEARVRTYLAAPVASDMTVEERAESG